MTSRVEELRDKIIDEMAGLEDPWVMDVDFLIAAAREEGAGKIVHCGNCVHFTFTYEGTDDHKIPGCLDGLIEVPRDDDFCSRGQRKEILNGKQG
jgi:hypothetical protein